jgi:hypothetical protein
MEEFVKLFSQSKGQPVGYHGEKIFMADRIDAELNDLFLVTIEKTDSQYLQGIGFSDNVSIFGETVKKAVVFEHFSIPPDERQKIKSKLPFSFEVTCKNKKRYILIYNMALVDGVQQWWYKGFAMKKENIENGWRYRCNDIKPNDDFTDLIFTIKKISK